MSPRNPEVFQLILFCLCLCICLFCRHFTQICRIDGVGDFLGGRMKNQTVFAWFFIPRP